MSKERLVELIHQVAKDVIKIPTDNFIEYLADYLIANGVAEKALEDKKLESRASENSEDWKRWLCIYHDGSFCFEREFGKRKKKYEQNLLCEDEIDLYGLEIIGNIHDNPELLRKEDEGK